MAIITQRLAPEIHAALASYKYAVDNTRNTIKNIQNECAHSRVAAYERTADSYTTRPERRVCLACALLVIGNDASITGPLCDDSNRDVMQTDNITQFNELTIGFSV